jgi:hypothetical protein
MSVNVDVELAKDLSKFVADPLGFIKYVFPWGKQGTVLESYAGPDDWQCELLSTLGDEIRKRKFNGVTPVDPIMIAISSGHGVGKSCFTAWMILFIMSTRPHCRGIVTSNTYPQLQSKTWSELAKWHKLAINSHWFEYTGTKGNLSLTMPAHKQSWRFEGVASSEHQSEAFAGLHNAQSSPVFVFDEASAIPDSIFDVARGGTTDGEPFVIALGNPTRNTGWFIKAIRQPGTTWITRCIDSRKARMTNKAMIQQWLEEYGENSDFFKVRVKGEPPSASSNQLISHDIVTNARNAKLREDEYQFQTLIIGVDVAREGTDESVICVRQGRKVLQQVIYVGLNNVQLALRVAEIYKSYPKVHGLLIDVVGVGAGVVDYLKHLGYPAIGVISGEKSDDPQRYFNRRAEMWCKLRDWLVDGADIPDDHLLADQLTTQEYFYTTKEQYQLVSKKDMKSSGLSSPDRADALAFTFSQVVHHDQSSNSFEPDFFE